MRIINSVLSSEIVYPGIKSEILKLIEEVNIFTLPIRLLGWYILVFLNFLFTELKGAITYFLNFTLTNTELLNKMQEYAWQIIPISILVIILLKVFLPSYQNNVIEKITSMLLILSFYTVCFYALNEFTSIGQSIANDNISLDSPVKVYNVVESVEENKLVVVDTKNIALSSFNINASTGDKPLDYIIEFMSKDGKAYGREADDNWVMDDEANYVYNYEFLYPFAFLLGANFFMIAMIGKLIKFQWEIFSLKIYSGVIIVATGGKKISMLLSSFISMSLGYIVIAGNIQLFTVALNLFNTMRTTNLIYSIVFLFTSILFLINGSEYVLRMIDSDVSAKSSGFFSKYIGMKMFEKLALNHSSKTNNSGDGSSNNQNNSQTENDLNNYVSNTNEESNDISSSSSDNSNLNNETSSSDNSNLNNEMSSSDNSNLNNEMSPSDNSNLNNEMSSSDNSNLNNETSSSDNSNLNNETSSSGNSNLNNEMSSSDNSNLNNEMSSSDNSNLNNEMSSSDNSNLNNEINSSNNSSLNSNIDSSSNSNLSNVINSQGSTSDSNNEIVFPDNSINEKNTLVFQEKGADINED